MNKRILIIASTCSLIIISFCMVKYILFPKEVEQVFYSSMPAEEVLRIIHVELLEKDTIIFFENRKKEVGVSFLRRGFLKWRVMGHGGYAGVVLSESNSTTSHFTNRKIGSMNYPVYYGFADSKVTDVTLKNNNRAGAFEVKASLLNDKYGTFWYYIFTNTRDINFPLEITTK